MTIYCRYIKWKLCENHGFEGASQWYKHELDEVVANEGYEILWNYAIQCYTRTEARRQDIVIIDKTKKEVKIVDVPMPRMHE